MQVITSPSSSLVWVQYMAHHLAQGEVSAARQTAERALRTIHFRCLRALPALCAGCSYVAVHSHVSTVDSQQGRVTYM